MLQPGHHGAEHLHPAAAIATGSFKAEIINANTQFAKLLAGALMPFKHIILRMPVKHLRVSQTLFSLARIT